MTEAGQNLLALPASQAFEEGAVIPYAYRPFDIRYTYYDSSIWARAVARLKACVDGSPVLLTTKIVKDSSFSHVFITRVFADVIFSQYQLGKLLFVCRRPRQTRDGWAPRSRGECQS